MTRRRLPTWTRSSLRRGRVGGAFLRRRRVIGRLMCFSFRFSSLTLVPFCAFRRLVSSVKLQSALVHVERIRIGRKETKREWERGVGCSVFVLLTPASRKSEERKKAHSLSLSLSLSHFVPSPFSSTSSLCRPWTPLLLLPPRQRDGPRARKCRSTRSRTLS